MAADEVALPEEDVRRIRLRDGRVAIVRIRHRLQKIQDEMDALKRRQLESGQRRSQSRNR